MSTADNFPHHVVGEIRAGDGFVHGKKDLELGVTQPLEVFTPSTVFGDAVE
ncbi:hypothetical protein GTV32_15075 [Gordonia sp. SID5947]|uniref:hypothetical protein n=1 Tax=Gordonia sp. SID5947 TaxID=2690315 RepID=UPI00136852B0|nr:hypothetical protein [Gordonia sp. SID5947]MYR07542.1 hypothetical protein [Gordonia sp. SID5947]